MRCPGLTIISFPSLNDSTKSYVCCQVNGKIAGSPSFFGANPAEVREGPRKGLRVLAAEEDLARDLLESLTAEQKKVAIIVPEAYKDILTMASRKAALAAQPSGLSAAKMTKKQF